jgi:uncharacterized protein (DUF885 family)
LALDQTPSAPLIAATGFSGIIMSFNRRALLQGSAATLALAAMPAEAQTGDAAADRMLGRITEQLLRDYPTSATGAGVDKDGRARLRSRLDDRSPSGQRTIKGHVRSTLGQLRRLDTEAMSAEKRLDIDVVRTAFELAAEGFEFPYGDVAVLNSNWSYRNTPYAVAQNVGAFVEIPSFLDSSHSITTADDADAYLARMEAYARQLDGETARVRADGGRGVVLPDFLLDKTLQQLRTSRAAPVEQWGRRSPHARPAPISPAPMRRMRRASHKAASHQRLIARSQHLKRCAQKRTAMPAFGICRRARNIMRGRCARAPRRR